MLFRGLDGYLLPHVQPRSMPHFMAYIDTLNIRRGIITDRYVTTIGYESNFVVLLRKILGDADIPNLLRRPNDLACYLDVLSYTAQDLNSIFDAVTTGLTFTNMAVQRNPGNTAEFFIPVQCQDPVSMLPMDQGWDAWQFVKPIRLVDIDSLELTFQTYQDQIVFRKNFPTRAVFTIDVVALVLQYVNFLRINAPDYGQPAYLHTYVLVHLLQDLQDLWLGNIYNAVLSQPELLGQSARPHTAGDPFYGWVGSEIGIAVDELKRLALSCSGGGTTPSVLFKSLRLSHGDVPAFLQTLIHTTSIDDRRQNLWMEYLRDIRWLSLLYNTYQLQPDFIATRNLHTMLRRDIPLLINTQFWKNARDPKTRHFIEQNVRDCLSKMA